MFIQLRKDYFGQKAGARVDVDEPVARSLVAQGVAEALSDDPLAPVIARSLESVAGGLTRQVGDALDATPKEFAAAQTRSRKNAVPAVFGRSGEGDPRHNFGDWLLCVRRNDARRLAEEYQSFPAEADVGQKAAMSTGVGT